MPNLNCLYVILKASDYVKIKMKNCPRVGKLNEPITEQTKMGRLLMSPGRENNLVSSKYTMHKKMKFSIRDF